MFSSKRLKVRRPVIYAVASAAAAIATTGLLASSAFASTTPFPWQGQGQGFSLYNNDGNASGTITLCAANQWGGKVRDCTSQSFTVSVPQPFPTPTPLPRHH